MTPSPLQALFSRSGGNQAAARARFRRNCPAGVRGHPADREGLAVRAYEDAITLAALVRDEDPAVVFGALTEYSHEQLSVLAVVLAALMPLGLPASELAGWIDWAPEPQQPRGRARAG